MFSHSVVSNSLQPHGLQHTSHPCPWDFPGENTGVGCHFFLQGIFQTQGLNPGLLHCRHILYRSATREALCFTVSWKLCSRVLIHCRCSNVSATYRLKYITEFIIVSLIILEGPELSTQKYPKE